jgi:predicted DNA-binding transcriptional regulator YafY
MAKGSKVEAITKRGTEVRNYITQNPECNVSDLLEDVKLTENTFYQVLNGLKDDRQVCGDTGEYYICRGETRLTVNDIEKYLASPEKKEKQIPNKAERMLYLYNILHNALPDGGLHFERISDLYLELISHYGEGFPSDTGLKRMIYRDLESLEKMGIGIIRPSPKAQKYCLMQAYLPKLPQENAAILYVSMLLFKGTLLHQAMDASRSQIEKSFFKSSPEIAERMKQRIHVVGDTLRDATKFGDTLGKLMVAVTENMRVRMGYINNQGIASLRTIDPLGIIFKRSVWYLVARLTDSEEYRTFRVDQVQHLNLRETDIFDYPDHFTLKDHIGSSWGVYNNDQVQKVILKFSPSVAMRVKNLCYHPSELLLEELADGSVIIQYEVCGLVEMQSWIIQWGDTVTVLEPLELCKQIKEYARRVYHLYE